VTSVKKQFLNILEYCLLHYMLKILLGQEIVLLSNVIIAILL